MRSNLQKRLGLSLVLKDFPEQPRMLWNSSGVGWFLFTIAILRTQYSWPITLTCNHTPRLFELLCWCLGINPGQKDTSYQQWLFLVHQTLKWPSVLLKWAYPWTGWEALRVGFLLRYESPPLRYSISKFSQHAYNFPDTPLIKHLRCGIGPLWIIVDGLESLAEQGME